MKINIIKENNIKIAVINNSEILISSPIYIISYEIFK